jgi:hypothetical protein
MPLSLEGRASADQLSRTHVPMSPNVTEPTHLTKASDMYAFGVLTREVRMVPIPQRCSLRSLQTGPNGAISVR